MLAATSLVAVAGPAAPSAADEWTPVPFQGSFAVTLVGEPGEYVTAGLAHLYSNPEDRLSVYPRDRDLLFEVLFDRPYQTNISRKFDFRPAPGDPEPLGVGYYDNTVDSPGPDPTQPTMYIAGAGHGCNTTSGHFEIRELERTPDGYIKRLHLLFEQYCEDAAQPAMFGEIRIGMPRRPVAVQPAALSWPDSTQANSHSRAFPFEVTSTSPGPVRIRALSLDGPTPGQFTLRGGTCERGTRIDGGRSCTARIRFTPTRAGPASATLRTVTSAGRETARLDANARVGVTSWRMHSEPGDFVGQGQDYHFVDGTDGVALDFTEVPTSNGPRYLYAQVATMGSGGAGWDGEFIGSAEHDTSEGSYPDAVRFPYGMPSMSVSGMNRGCNNLTGQFTVDDIGRDAAGTLNRLDLSFTQYCDDDTAPLRGRIRFNQREDHIAPGPVRRVVADRASGRVRLRWLAPADTDIRGYAVRWYTGDAVAQRPRVGGYAYLGPRPSVELRDPGPGTPLTFTLFAVDHTGNLSAARIISLP